MYPNSFLNPCHSPVVKWYVASSCDYYHTLGDLKRVNQSSEYSKIITIWNSRIIKKNLSPVNNVVAYTWPCKWRVKKYYFFPPQIFSCVYLPDLIVVPDKAYCIHTWMRTHCWCIVILPNTITIQLTSTLID